MPRNPDRSAHSLTRGPALVLMLLAGAPLAAQAQSHGTLKVEAVVVSPEGTRAWEAVARRLAPSATTATAAPASSTAMLATIDDRTIGDSHDPLNRRRVLTIEYLRN